MHTRYKGLIVFDPAPVLTAAWRRHTGAPVLLRSEETDGAEAASLHPLQDLAWDKLTGAGNTGQSERHITGAESHTLMDDPPE